MKKFEKVKNIHFVGIGGIGVLDQNPNIRKLHPQNQYTKNNVVIFPLKKCEMRNEN